jgi:hypothetical protein
MVDSISRIKSVITQNSINIPGWRTRRKIVVIESDDWGSIRMPSTDVYKRFVSRGFDIARSDYNRLDTLERNDDLASLFDILSSFKDSKGNPPVVTANYITGNPDFVNIRNSGFNEYYFEPVTKTLERYPDCDRIKDLWIKGLSAGMFHPQFHGREHVNVVRWMDALKKGGPEILYTFENETTFSGKGDYNFMEVLDYNTTADLEKMNESLVEGLDLFEMIFGFRSKSFIPPCYTWDSNVEEILHKNGVRYLQGLVVQSVPTGSFGNYKRKYHFLGNRNQFGQYFLIRNCFFEPSLSETSDPVGECLNRINIAFRWNKPAVISAHRINFIGSLVEKNRTDNLKLLRELLHRITKNWPDVEFMTSDQLGDLIAESYER